MEDHIPERQDRSLLIGRQTSKWSLWDVIFHENYSNSHLCMQKIVKSKYSLSYSTRLYLNHLKKQNFNNSWNILYLSFKLNETSPMLCAMQRK